MTQTSSRPVLYEVVAKDGEIWGRFKTMQHAALFAASHWPDQEQDEERKGFGWDVQVVAAIKGGLAK